MRKWGSLLLAGAVAVLAAGCSTAPDTLAGTEWKITALKAPDGTAYEEAAYDAIIGETRYRFGEDGKMDCLVGGLADDTEYTYTYGDGELKIVSEGMVCTGTVEKKEMKLALGELGEAVLTRQSS